MGVNHETTEGEFLFKRHYPALDFLRTIAITMVMVVHYVDIGFNIPNDGMVRELVSMGIRGVSLFFVLSGFLIGGQIIEEVKSGSFHFKKFYIKRFWRIFPPYYVALIAVVVLYSFGVRDDMLVLPGTDLTGLLENILYHALYLQNFIPPKIMGAIYWTLSIEEQFYIVAPLFIFLIMRYRRSALLIFLVAVIAGGICLQSLLSYGDPDMASYKPWFTISFYYLLFGVLVAYLYITFHERLMRLSAMAKFVFIVVPAIFFIISMVWKGDPPPLLLFKISVYTPMLALGFASLILWSVITPFNVIIRPRRVFALIARLSYSMYLYHVILVLPVVKVVSNIIEIDSALEVVLNFFVYYIVVLLVTSAIFRLVDKPCMDYRRKVVARLDKRVGVVVTPGWR